MRRADDAGLVWGEETITELILANAHPEILSVPFNKRQERHVGADWLWWWVDDMGEAFGMLIQAKRLHDDWHIDFAYRGGEQMDALRSAAKLLHVVDAYILYLGSRQFRTAMPIDGVKHYRVLHRHNSGVSYAPGWIVSSLTTYPGPQVEVTRAIARSAPLESLILKNSFRPPVAPPSGLRAHNPELFNFLTTRQSGARGVARKVLDLVMARRLELYRRVEWPTEVALPDDSVFNRVLADPGHGDEPYMMAVLRGLRREAPDYVQRALEGEPIGVPVDVPSVEGMVIARIGQE
ncbi:MAG: hypothetical protein ACOYBY_12915 [Dermatophilaceae bacterium]